MRTVFLLLASARIASAGWFSSPAKRPEDRWPRTQAELANYNALCPHTPPASASDGVLVFDARHGDWVGIGDSVSRVLALLRLGQHLQVRTFIWMDHCADKYGPARSVVGRRSNGTTCSFDAGEWFESINGDWRWTTSKRRLVARMHKQEHAMAYTCTEEGEGGRCRRARVPFDAGNEIEVLKHALRVHRWVRIELTTLDDFRSIGDAIPHNRRCELFAALRPKTVLWNALAPHLDKAVHWKALGGLAVRTGLADHADLFKPPSKGRSFDIERVMRLFESCPEGARAVSRFASEKHPPCVHYQPHAGAPRFFPGGGQYFELAAYARNVTGMAREIASDNKDAWGSVVFTDSPAVYCALQSIVGKEKLLATSHPAGHTQYSASRAIALAAAVDFYLVGLVDFLVQLTPSKFSGVGQERSMLAPGSLPPRLSHGWPQFFLAGNEREMMSQQTQSVRHAWVVETLMQTC